MSESPTYGEQETAAGEIEPISEGRTDDLARAQALAKSALDIYAKERVNMAGRRLKA